MMDTDITTTKEGIRKLAELEGVAKGSFRKSKEAFDEAMFAMIRIRDEGLWVYSRDEDGVLLMDYEKPRFKEDYLYLFCRRIGISKSATYEHIGTVEVMRYLGWTNEKIASVGVKELSPVRFLVKIDGRSNEVVLPPQEVIETLPPGSTPRERIAKKVEEVFIEPAEPLSQSDRRKALVVDTGIAPDAQLFQAGDGSIWYTYTHGNECWDGELIPAANYKEISNEAREYLVKRMRIQEYLRRDDEDS